MSKEALGFIEGKGLISVVAAADAALKAADVTMTGWETVGSGLVTAVFQGDVASVKAAVEAGAEAAKMVGEVLSAEVIARPHDELGGLGAFLPS